MPASSARSAAGPAITIMIAALVVSGCVRNTAERTAGPAPTSSASTASTAASTATTFEPTTDSELAWLSQITKLRQSIQKTISPSANATLTRAELARWENAMRGCRRTLVRIGPSSARLRPVDALVRQACEAYDKGAACFAEAAPLLSSSSRVREAQQDLDCGSRALEKGATLLAAAESKGLEIRLSG